MTHGATAFPAGEHAHRHEIGTARPFFSARPAARSGFTVPHTVVDV
jgi:hypothetical protein